MVVIDVVPIAKGVFRHVLSYFTADSSVSPGSLVEVSVRGKKIHGLVVSVRDPILEKAELRASTFSLKKIETLKSHAFLDPACIEAMRDTATFFGGYVGQVLATFVPKTILESKHHYTITKGESQRIPPRHIRETLVLQASDDERFSEYKSLVRERFARGQSVYLCFPTTHEVDELLETLDRGIREYSFILHSGLSLKTILATWKQALESQHPVLIVGMGSFLSIPRHDLGTIIVERESSRFYKSNTRPYPDVRTFAEFLAKRKGIELIFGDMALRVETIYKVKQGKFAEFGTSLQRRSLWSGVARIVDMRAQDTRDEKKKKFEILSDAVRDTILNLKTNNERLFLLTSRRGLSPLTICGDCHTVVECNRCSATVTLHRGASKTFFLCHHCGERRSTEERCKNCTGWKLESLGIGIELLEEVVRKEFPDVRCFRLDRDTVKGEVKARSIVQKFYDTPGSILIGTEVALYFLNEKIEHTAVISIDSLFSLPDFRIGERIFSLLLSIRSKTLKTMIIQTRNKDSAVLNYAAAGTISEFYEHEIAIRQKFFYPPYSTLIKISLEGTKDEVEKKMNGIEQLFSNYEFSLYPAFISTKKGHYSLHGLLKIKQEEWPKLEVLQKFEGLSPQFKIQVNPESLL